MNEIKIVKWPEADNNDFVAHFLERPAFDPEAERVAAKMLEDIGKNGDNALLKYAKAFDDSSLTLQNIKVTGAEIIAAREQVDHAFMASAREAHKRIIAFAKAGIKKDWTMSSEKGGILGEQFVPIERVGAYIPGGAAPLVSTCLMTVTLAKTAGSLEIVACTPPAKDGTVNPYLLFALDLAGATEIYKLGGIQAIGAMALGTETIKKVSKIVGPGGHYVTAAKKLVYGHVALDLVAGPSEIAVMADDTARAENIAADLLSQAEHGSGHEKMLLVTNSLRLAKETRESMLKQIEQLSRKEIILKTLHNGTLLTVVNNLDAAMDLCNKFAPEHLEIMVREPRRWLKKVKNAGAVFIGEWTPESVGDFAAGPSHVLPTGGTATMFSGLTVEDFRKKTSVISYTRADLMNSLKIIEDFSRVEGLDAHGRCAQIRFEANP